MNNQQSKYQVTKISRCEKRTIRIFRMNRHRSLAIAVVAAPNIEYTHTHETFAVCLTHSIPLNLFGMPNINTDRNICKKWRERGRTEIVN